MCEYLLVTIFLFITLLATGVKLAFQQHIVYRIQYTGIIGRMSNPSLGKNIPGYVGENGINLFQG